MTKRKGGSNEESPTLEPGAGINATNYVERARAYVSLTPEKRGTVIRAVDGENGATRTGEAATDAQWLAWLGYFVTKGIKHSFMIAHGVATVPAEWPDQFDMEVPLSDRTGVLPRRSFAERRVMQDRVAGLFRNLRTAMRSWPTGAKAQRPQTPEEARQTAAERLIELEELKDVPLDDTRRWWDRDL